MIASVLALVAAASAAQATDTTRSAREAFTACLRGYVNHSVESGTTLEAFRAAYPQQCTAQESAFRDAIVRRDTAMRATRASAQESAQLEVDDARANFSDRFESSLPAAPATAAASSPAPSPSTPAATPASATTPATQPPTR